MLRFRHCLIAVAMTVCLSTFQVNQGHAQDQQPATQATAEMNREKLEKAFSEKLTKSVLVGHFSVDGKKDNGGREERYEIDSVTKLKGNDWLFVARIKYGQNDVKVPMTLKVLWAGDTPVITLTDLMIPGLGTFTSRVLFYGDRYVGTWQHGEVGGHMWGRIEQAKSPEKGEDNDSSN